MNEYPVVILSRTQDIVDPRNLLHPNLMDSIHYGKFCISPRNAGELEHQALYLPEEECDEGPTIEYRLVRDKMGALCLILINHG